MKKTGKFLFAVICLIIAIAINPILCGEAAGEKLYLGGFAAGFVIETRGADVIGLSDVITKDGVKSPSKDAGIEVGDVIMSINGAEINNAKDIGKSLSGNKGTLTVEISRKGEKLLKPVIPVKDVNGNIKIGVFVRDELNGIGTITYMKSDLQFAALGHPVLDENGNFLNVSGGKVYRCSVVGVVKGERGKPGELQGLFIEDELFGTISKNTDVGLYGKMVKKSQLKGMKQIETGEAEVGKASIYTCIDGLEGKEYSISIVKIDKNNGENKNLVIKVTDVELLKKTNGILQGMSGSPIVQNGKLIGAVTHVFVNDPSRGFGILIDKMLAG